MRKLISGGGVPPTAGVLCASSLGCYYAPLNASTHAGPEPTCRTALSPNHHVICMHIQQPGQASAHLAALPHAPYPAQAALHGRPHECQQSLLACAAWLCGTAGGSRWSRTRPRQPAQQHWEQAGAKASQQKGGRLDPLIAHYSRSFCCRLFISLCGMPSS